MSGNGEKKISPIIEAMKEAHKKEEWLVFCRDEIETFKSLNEAQKVANDAVRRFGRNFVIAVIKDEYTPAVKQA